MGGWNSVPLPTPDAGSGVHQTGDGVGDAADVGVAVAMIMLETVLLYTGVLREEARQGVTRSQARVSTSW